MSDKTDIMERELQELLQELGNNPENEDSEEEIVLELEESADDLEEEILKEYHIHRLSPEEKEMMDRVEEMNKVQEDTNVSVPVEETFETTTQEVDEEYPDLEEYDEGDFWNYPVLFDPEDEEEYGGYWGYGNNGISRLYIR